MKLPKNWFLAVIILKITEVCGSFGLGFFSFCAASFILSFWVVNQVNMQKFQKKCDVYVGRREVVFKDSELVFIDYKRGSLSCCLCLSWNFKCNFYAENFHNYVSSFELWWSEFQLMMNMPLKYHIPTNKCSPSHHKHGRTWRTIIGVFGKGRFYQCASHTPALNFWS